jgi:hypothetical protein
MAARLSFSTRSTQRLLELIKKPMARAWRASLFQRQLSYQLSSAAIELLIERAQVLSEGQIEGTRYFGSTMISLDLRRLEDEVSDPASAATARRLGDLAAEDSHLRRRAGELARAEAERLAGRRLERCQIDLSARARGAQLHIDLDVEARLSD